MLDAVVHCSHCTAALTLVEVEADACPHCGAAFAVVSERAHGATDYGAALRSPARALWLGVVTYDQFWLMMDTAIRHYLPLAWEAGLAQVGIAPEEQTPEERMALQRAINSEFNYVNGFAEFIEAHAKAKKGKWGAVNNRVKLWINRYRDLQNRAKALAGRNKKLKWVRHLVRVTKQSCVDCLKLDGRVYRAKTWLKWDVRPQHPNLACGGLLCGCGFQVTDEPCTPGRPPKLSGG